MPDRHDSTRTLPRGSVARDRSGDYLITWPDGRYGYDPQHQHGPAASQSTGPYALVIDGLTERECDAFARLDPPARRSVVAAYEALLGLSASIGGFLRRLGDALKS